MSDHELLDTALQLKKCELVHHANSPLHVMQVLFQNFNFPCVEPKQEVVVEKRRRVRAAKIQVTLHLVGLINSESVGSQFP